MECLNCKKGPIEGDFCSVHCHGQTVKTVVIPQARPIQGHMVTVNRFGAMCTCGWYGSTGELECGGFCPEGKAEEYEAFVDAIRADVEGL